MPTDEPPRPGKGKAYRPPPTLLQPLWERQPDETSAQWEAFRIYLDLKPKRTLGRTAKARGTKPNAEGLYFSKSVNKWAVYWRWKERAVAHDAYVARRLREATLNAQVKEQARAAAKWERRKNEVLEHGYLAAEKLLSKIVKALDEPHAKGQISPKDQALMLVKCLESLASITATATKAIDQYQPHELEAIADATTPPDEVAGELAEIEQGEADERIYRDDVALDDLDGDGSADETTDD